MINRNKINLELQVPFCNSTGNQLGYPQYGYIMKANYIFSSTMQFKYFSRGRSSVKAIFEDKEGTKYEMFAKDFQELIKDNVVELGEVEGNWSFVKRGANYGLTQVTEY